METQTLPRWKSHKEVEAFKIYKIEHYPVRDRKDCLAATLYGEFPLVGLPYCVDVRLSYWEKHQPKVGGYYVRYKDGYESYSPAEAFEEGYVPLVAAGIKTGNKTANEVNNKQKPILVQNPPGVWEWKAMFRAKLISSLYAEFSKRHPEASTDYSGAIERLGDTVSIRPKPKLGAFQIFINLVISHEVVFPYPDQILRTRDAIEAEECIGEVIAKLCLPTSPIKAFAAQILDNGETYSIVWGVLAEPNTVKPPLEVQSWKDKQCRDCTYWAKDVPDIIHRKPCLLPSEAKIEMPKVLTHATYSCPDWKRVEVES